ncbi:DNSL3 Deoxyribonuclease, partial [Polypterus senegalus]
MLSGYIFILLTFTGAAALKICSFNIRSFGENKIAKPENLDVIVKIISRCDLMLLMEIKDVRNKAFPELMKQLNRQSVVSVKEIYQYPDQQTGDEDVFSREPFVVWFDSPKTAVKEFIIIPLHTTPETSVREIDELYDVYLNVKQRWSSEQNFIFMGDFNADCGYVPKKDWKNIRLRSDTSFVWLIDDNMDTSVKETTNCAYDRIVVHGEAINKAIDLESLEIFNFKAAFGLTEEEALAVSDHFPVAVELRKARGFITWFKSLRDKVLKTK